MKRVVDAFIGALAYFTILPAGKSGPPGADALAALPYVGGLIGGLAGAAAWGVSYVLAAPLVTAAAFAASIVLTGALHVDGFLDTCDALFARVTPQRRLEILKDPRHGTFAVAGFAVVVIVWLAAVAGISAPYLPAVLAFCAALARWAAVLNALLYPDAREPANSPALASKPPVFVVGITGVLLGAAAWCFGLPYVLLVPIAAGVAVVLGRALKTAFGGMTGDLYGFVIVLFETALLVAMGTLLENVTT
ncbi:MAG TPA: adenosylcobinamide-GDP ribazoletransferase [Candidatus Acidoferrales bacterium]|nr:adenosylcobinamide-GDP ribazoletransferase [Candidatus Acidoferrales bacterium]